MSDRRPGFSLAELMVALLISGIIGVALSRLVISQSRFVSMQDQMMRVRSAARAALNVISSELRSVTDSGLVQASPDSITVRVPYAFGLACQQSGGSMAVSLIPTDSATYGAAQASGYAWRDSLFHPVTATVGTGSCSAPTRPITTLSAPGWTARVVSVTPNVVAVQVGAVVYLFQVIRYAFAPSVEVPGRRALWRHVLSTGVRDELVVPFDTSARFQFIVGNSHTVQSAAPAVLDSVRGVRVRLVTTSEVPPQGRSIPVQFDLTTDILFRNNARQ